MAFNLERGQAHLPDLQITVGRFHTRASVLKPGKNEIKTLRMLR